MQNISNFTEKENGYESEAISSKLQGKKNY